MLSKGRNPANVRHDWVMIGTFGIPEQAVEQLAAARADTTGEGRADVQLSQEMLTSLDGPGCKVCGLEWTIGYGIPCQGAPDIREQLASVAPPPMQVPKPSGIVLPNGQDSTGGGLLLPPDVR